MPTGTAIRDVRQQLFEAAERILVRDGPNALTSRAVTAEAGCAKGVLHRHFEDFDAFLAELVRDRIAGLSATAAALHEGAGRDTVTDNLTTALVEIFEPVAVAVVSLVTFRDELRTRLRASTPAGIPLLAEATTVLASYLEAERKLRRIAPGTDIDALAPTLIGTGHLIYADRTSASPDRETVRTMVSSALAGAIPP